MIREGVFGFPMQAAFDLTAVRAETGQHRRDLRAGDPPAIPAPPAARVLFPLMKFMYEYCTRYFDTRHLVIAVNPNKIELYESLLFFQRLQAAEVDHYDFANGAPAVGAALDLRAIPQLLLDGYGGRPRRKNLHRYFIESTICRTCSCPRAATTRRTTR
ncbi:MAG: hypothetical protein MZW92_21015 [Comamonadaceae bacterium]|nr:hypothetical protein [Comamonadaceae bacterium]